MSRNAVCAGALSVAAAFAITAPLPALADYLSATPYTSFADSPFSGVSFDTFFLEDFEDGSLNTSGVSASAGRVLVDGTLRDSVDADDGAIDGSGSGGYSYYLDTSTVDFTFSAVALGGRLPTHVGVVWTDVGFASPTNGYGSVKFEAFDAANISLGLFGPLEVGDGVYGGQTAEDLFLGIVHAGGISRITISMTGSSDWEIDHLQYGVVPVPAALPIIGAALAGFGFAGWRTHRKAA